MSLSDTYRPATLGAMVGNPRPRAILNALCSKPVPSAWLLEGPSGIGKTTAALCVAGALGSPLDVLQINGQDMNSDKVRELAETVRLASWRPNGWRVVIIDEADRMSEAAQVLWLSLLENLGRCVVIFTSNEKSDFEPRFLSRLKVLHYTTQGMAPAGAAYLQSVAAREGFPLDERTATKLMREAGNNLRAALQALELEAMVAGTVAA